MHTETNTGTSQYQRVSQACTPVIISERGMAKTWRKERVMLSRLKVFQKWGENKQRSVTLVSTKKKTAGVNIKGKVKKDEYLKNEDSWKNHQNGWDWGHWCPSYLLPNGQSAKVLDYLGLLLLMTISALCQLHRFSNLNLSPSRICRCSCLCCSSFYCKIVGNQYECSIIF